MSDTSYANSDTSYARSFYDQEEFDKKFLIQPPQLNLKERLKQCLFKCSQKSFKNALFIWFPFLSWLPNYHLRYLVPDFFAGITSSIIGIPQAMAYANVAGVPTVIGLYTTFFATLLYAFFGTAVHQSLGLTATLCLMIGAAQHRSGIADRDNITNIAHGTDIWSIESVRNGAALTFAVGIILLIMTVFRLHTLIATWLSDSVVRGFTTGNLIQTVAVLIPQIFSVPVSSKGGLFKVVYTMIDFFTNIQDTNFCALIISVACLVILIIGNIYINPYVVKKYKVPIPFEIILVIITTILSHFLHFHGKYDVEIVSHIPEGFPSLHFPEFSRVFNMLPDAIAIAIVVFGFMQSINNIFGKKHGYEANTGQEIRVLTLCHILPSFFMCLPSGGAMSRSSVLSQIGAASQIAKLVCASFIFILIMWLGFLISELPMCVLSAIILVSLKPFFLQFNDLPILWKTCKIDFLIWVVSFLVTTFWEISEGLYASILFALFTVIIRSQYSKYSKLEPIGETDVFADDKLYKNTNYSPFYAIYRFDSPLLFLQIARFKQSAMEILKSTTRPNTREIQFLILDSSGITDIDRMGALALVELVKDLEKTKKIKLLVAASSYHFRDICEKCQVYKTIPKKLFFPLLQDAIFYVNNEIYQRKQSVHIELFNNEKDFSSPNF